MRSPWIDRSWLQPSFLSLLISVFLFTETCLAKARPEDQWIKAYQPNDLSLLTKDQHFRLNIGSEPETLDPGILTGSPEIRVAIGLFEGLLSYDPSTLKPVPGVAYKYEVDTSGKIYTFYLRDDAKWSDGTPITAVDFYKSWERVLNPKTGAKYSSQLYPIQGAEAYNKKEIVDFNQVGVKVKSKYILEVTLHNPCPYFTDLCAFVTLYPTPVHLIEKHGDAWVRPENIISNGPFRVTSWVSRSVLTMEPNPHYWDREHVHLKKVSAYLYDDIDTYYKLFLQGNLDWIDDVPSSKTKEVRWNPEYYSMPVLGTYFYRFNVTRPPLDDIRVRQALSMSIDRTVITRQILKGGQQPAKFFCPPVAGYQHVEGLPYDTDKAKQLLKEAGYGEGGKEFPSLEILYNTQDDHKKIAEAISETWRDVLGIEVKLRNTEWKIYLSEMNQLNFDICRSAWYGDYGDPNTFFDMFIKDGGNNRTGWTHPQYDKWLKESQLEPNHSKRLKIFQKMEKMLVSDEAPLMPLYIYVNRGMLAKEVHGWYENVIDFHPIKHIWMEKE